MLGGGQPDTTLVRAAAANQTAWLARIAEAAGGTVHRERGVTWMVSRAGAVLAFPRLSSRRLAVLLPDFLAAAGSAEASCWSLLPTEPEDLDLRLREAGFRDGWQAHWMARTIEDVEGDPAAPGVSIAVAEGDWSVTKLPWDEAGIASVRTRLASARPRRVWHVAVWRDDEAVGHATLNVTTGRLGVAGIYDMGVASHERRRGIGTALTHAVLARARGAGCAVATLNATADGEHLYRKLGFRSVGFAQTWWR
ncbi:MAG TPA: GNAT family N-acetyltransferase [Gaiellaceae bacterium]|jgi:GNAT superfamily N-acetyltransferase|nr:GNAT family N-acetyltransferase [Gaiellaceae bacterium]